MASTDTLRREYSARDFNRNPSAISRAAHRFGNIKITYRGEPSLVVVDAARYPELVRAGGSASLLESLASSVTWDEDVIGEPPRTRITLRSEDEA